MMTTKRKEDLSIKDIKETYQNMKKDVNFILDVIAPNRIPSKPEDIIAMRERLVKEEKLKAEVKTAKADIKKILDSRKQERKAVKAERRRRIKSFFGKIGGKK